jgi:hypothetical protein
MNTMNRLFTNIYIATDHGDGFDGKVGTKDFWSTAIGSQMRTLMGVVGIIVVVYAVLKAVKNIAAGKVGDSVKGILGAIVLAAVLFNPPLIQNAIRASAKLVESAINTVSDLGDIGSPSSSVPASGDYQPDDPRQ